MNEWIRNSINLANNSNYLDRLFEIYPTIPNQPRKISKEKWYNIEVAYNNRDDRSLLTHLLYLDLFPIKDSYVAFLKKTSIRWIKTLRLARDYAHFFMKLV